MGAETTSGLSLRAVCDLDPERLEQAQKDFSDVKVYTSADTLLEDPGVDVVIVATAPNTHARLCLQMMAAGKHVICEKPLALKHDELNSVREAYRKAHEKDDSCAPQLMVGYNRRFSPQIKRMKSLLSSVVEPKSFVMTMNAGEIPADHWTQDLEVGGGRIIGEACHYVDLMRHLAGCPIVSVQARCMGKAAGVEITEDKAAITLGFEDGSFGTILYLANGAQSFPKERIEVFTAGAVLQLDNFRRLKGYGWPGFTKYNLWRQDKGQQACVTEFLNGVELGETVIPYDEVIEVAQVTIEIVDQLRKQ